MSKDIFDATNAKCGNRPVGRIVFSPQNGTCFKTNSTCSDCARLKVLLSDLWKLREDLSTEEIDEYNFLTETLKLEARIKQEGIE